MASDAAARAVAVIGVAVIGGSRGSEGPLAGEEGEVGGAEP